MSDGMDQLASDPQQQERHKEPRGQHMHHQPEKRRNMGHPRERRGGSHDAKAAESSERTREIFSKNAAERRNQGQEVGKWEAGGRGPHREPTAEDSYWRQMRQKHGEVRTGRGEGPITEPTAKNRYWGDRRGGPEQGGWIQGRKGKHQHRDRIAEEGWWFSEQTGRGAWTGHLAEDGYWGTTGGTAPGGRGWKDKEAAPGWERRERFGGEEWKWGEKRADRGTETSSQFREPEPSSWAKVMDMGMVMWGVIRADGRVPPWGSMKGRAMSSLCSGLFFMNRKREGDLMHFFRLKHDHVFEDRQVGEAPE